MKCSGSLCVWTSGLELSKPTTHVTSSEKSGCLPPSLSVYFTLYFARLLALSVGLVVKSSPKFAVRTRPKETELRRGLPPQVAATNGNSSLIDFQALLCCYVSRIVESADLFTRQHDKSIPKMKLWCSCVQNVCDASAKFNQASAFETGLFNFRHRFSTEMTSMLE